MKIFQLWISRRYLLLFEVLGHTPFPPTHDRGDTVGWSFARSTDLWLISFIQRKIETFSILLFVFQAFSHFFEILQFAVSLFLYFLIFLQLQSIERTYESIILMSGSIIWFWFFAISFWIFRKLEFEYFEKEQKMENIPNILAPVHEQLEENFIEDIVIDHFLEIISKDIVEFIYDC